MADPTATSDLATGILGGGNVGVAAVLAYYIRDYLRDMRDDIDANHRVLRRIARELGIATADEDD